MAKKQFSLPRPSSFYWRKLLRGVFSTWLFSDLHSIWTRISPSDVLFQIYHFCCDWMFFKKITDAFCDWMLNKKTPRIQKIIICLFNENRLLGEDRWVWNCGSLVMLQPLPRTRLIFRWCHLGQAWNASDARIPWSRLHHHVRAMLWHSQNEGAAWLRRFLNDQEHLRRHRCLNYSELTSKFF